MLWRATGTTSKSRNRKSPHAREGEGGGREVEPAVYGEDIEDVEAVREPRHEEAEEEDPALQAI